ncbi:uncharacterized protein K444DRAFT_633736 [Hyaloscypha bicolor E]|uniref:Uncharacterized protein n=1 Tax=Hyaloscypha bicolor E TaxID=1095630 RepID=A0A2J6SVP3_9HELO|nr:uncharacterized protein K444DRAFT_633736 [Hyaloscypha bicolor E]PMD54834.1 hypothetical protein K444DRAFT_633736 [Hyaloscypha bicolor E]
MQRALLPRLALGPSFATVRTPYFSSPPPATPHPLLSHHPLFPVHLYSTGQKPPPPPPPNPSFGSASFKDLGANRTVKIVVYFSLGVIATLETVAWTKFLWAKFGPVAMEGGGEED